MLGFSLGLGEATMYDWGWRIPFFVAGPMGLVGMYLRSRMEDMPIFREIEMAGEEEQSTSAELKDLLLGYWQPLLIMGGMVVALNVEIGRASCRERVCQYVSISVVAVSLKKKIENRIRDRMQ